MATVTCVCGKEVERGQVVSGVPLDATGDVFVPTKTIVKGAVVVSGEAASQLVGHYACVVKALGPARTLKAIQKGLLPNLDPDTLTEGRLKKFVPVLE